MAKLTDIGEIKRLFALNGFSFSKTLGQNFLINPTVCPNIAEQGGAGAGVCALEIGTGVGVLTRELAARCDKVAAVEIDERLKPILAETLADLDNIEVIFADVMKTDLRALIAERFGGRDVIVCANLPYYITSPVIMKLLGERLPVKAVTVMVQKEAADRICAAPGTRECGAITYAVNYYSKPRMLFRVNRGSFIPSPNVDSAVIRLDVRRERELSETEEEMLFRLVRAGFSQRRKQLPNPLAAEFGISKSDVADLLRSVGLDPAARAENLTLADFTALAKALAGKNEAPKRL